MKRLISLLMILAVLLSLCACGGQTNEPSESLENPTTEVTEAPTKEKTEVKTEFTPEELYGHIDQTKPNSDGVYKLWSAKGVANMANVPDGNFELLCNIDMEGASLSPIGTVEAPFTGKIDGKNFIISNFTLASEDEALGFVGVNEGVVQDLQLEGVTVTADASNKYIGALAGVNHNIVLRCKAEGTLNAEQTAQSAVIGGGIGSNTGEFTNSTITVNTKVSAPAACVGGIAGQTVGGKMAYVENYGALTVAGENQTVGLLVGTTENTPINNCHFLGADNSLNGALFTVLTGSEDESLITAALIRDNTPVEMTENEELLRDRVVQAMYDLCTIEYNVRENMADTDRSFSTEFTYYGMSYNSNPGTLARMQYCVDEEGYLKDFVYDMDPEARHGYIANDCSSGLIAAYWTISNTVDFGRCRLMYPWVNAGTLYVGDWRPDPSQDIWDSKCHIDYNGKEKIYECYALLKKGDAYVYNWRGQGGHTRMAAENAVVVRDQNGKIDPNYSYVISHEQGYSWRDTQNMIYSTCRVNHKFTFANMIYDWALPVTIEELQTGEMEQATAQLLNAEEGKWGMITGTVKTNYYLEYVELVITDSEGNEIFNHLMFANLGHAKDVSRSYNRLYCDEFDMARFAVPLSQINFQTGETYHYTISATNAPGDTFIVHEGNFTQGNA